MFYFSKKVRLFSQNDVLFLFYFLINPAGTTVPGPGGCTWSGGVPCLGGVPGPRGGVPGPGVYLVLGGTCSWGGVPTQGVYLAGGVYLPRGTCPGTPPREQNDKQV